jgi:hypothetical protein
MSCASSGNRSSRRSECRFVTSLPQNAQARLRGACVELCSVELWSVEQRAGARSWRREGRRGGAQADRLSRYIVTGLAIRLPIGVQSVGQAPDALWYYHHGRW